MENNIIIYSKLVRELKTGIDILVGQAAFKLWIKTVKIMFGSITMITQEPLDLYLDFDAIFQFLGKFTIRCIYFQKIC